MKTIATLLSTAILGFSLIASSAYAGNTNSPGVNKRQHHQVGRIKHGVKSGALTGRETARLMGEQIQNRHMERRFKSDGHLGVGERVRLHRDLNKSSRRIYRQKHDGQQR